MLGVNFDNTTNFMNIDKAAYRKCKLFSNLFGLSTEHGFESKSFVEDVMTSAKLDSLVNIDERTEWCDEYFLVDTLDRAVHFKHGIVDDVWALKWLGYLYKYWMITRNLKSSEVYSLYPYDRFSVCYSFHHTQDWDFVIEDIISSKDSYIV